MKPLAVVWHEWRADDVETNGRFLADFCGWTTTPMDDYDPDYLMFESAEAGPSGALLKSGTNGIGAGSLIYVDVDDLDAAIDRAEALGATVLLGRTLITQESGSFAIIQTPGGPPLGLVSDNPPPP